MLCVVARRSGSVEMAKREQSYLETIGESAGDLDELEARMKKFEKVPAPPEGVDNQTGGNGGHGGGHGHGEGEEEELTFLEEWQLVKSNGSVGSFLFFALEGNWVLWVYITNGWLRKHEWHLTSFWVCLGWFTLQVRMRRARSEMRIRRARSEMLWPSPSECRQRCTDSLRP